MTCCVHFGKLSELFNDFVGVVGAGVVNDNQFPVRVRLRNYGTDRFANELGGIVAGHDYGDQSGHLKSLRDEFPGFFLAAVVFLAGDPAGGEQVVAEVGGGVHALFGDAVALEHLRKRLEDYLQVAQEGDAPDVFQVVFDLLLPGHRVPAVNLG